MVPGRRPYRVRSGGTHTDFVAVYDMTFTIPIGGSLAMVGESGSGKTTTARMLTGQEPRGTPSAHSTRRLRRRHRVTELIDSVGLDERHVGVWPSALSGGQRQRVAIAKALAASPSVLVLDEAVSALDVSIQAQVLNLLADIRRTTGVALLFISHDLAVVRQISDEVLALQRGKIVEHGTTAQVLDRPQHPYTQRLLDSVPRRGWRPIRNSGLI